MQIAGWVYKSLSDKVENFELDRSVKLKRIISDKKDESKYLRELCNAGLKEKGFNKNKEYLERLDFELDVIKTNDKRFFPQSNHLDIYKN